MNRKKRADSVLAHLPLEQQRELCDWLLAGMSYEAAKLELADRYKVKTSLGALSDFWHDFCAPELLRRRASAVSTAEELAAEAAENPGRWDAASIEALKERVFDMLTRPGSDPKEVKALFDLVLKSRAQELEQRRIEVLEAKARAADAAKAVVGDEQLDAAQKAARLKEVFGL